MDRHTGSPVRQTMVDTVTRELLRGRGAENEVALEARVDNLHNHLLVGEADDQAVLRGVVLVLRLLFYFAIASSTVSQSRRMMAVICG